MMLYREFGATVQAQVMFQAAADLGDSNGLVGQGTINNLCLCSNSLSYMKLVGSGFCVKDVSAIHQPQRPQPS